MKKISAFLLVTVLFAADSAVCQPMRGPGPERLEKYKKMRMIEALELNEDEAARFVAKYNTHQSNVRDIMKQRMGIVDELEEELDKKGEPDRFEQLFARLEESEQAMFNERKRFHNDVKSMLTTGQMAKFFVFERNFNRDLREAMQDMRREWRRR
jgi:hypothetical protein